jgi:hypothetical protein
VCVCDCSLSYAAGEALVAYYIFICGLCQLYNIYSQYLINGSTFGYEWGWGGVGGVIERNIWVFSFLTIFV